MSVLIDSDILIEVLRGRDSNITNGWTGLVESSEPLFVSPVSISEIWAGSKPSEHEAISALFGALESVPIGHAIGEKAGQYLRLYRASHSVELGDALIAATASLHGLHLWTRNRKHFPMREVHFYQVPE